MNTSLFDRRRAERFAQLLDEANGGRRHHSRSGIDDQLGELIAVGHRLGTMNVSGMPEASFKRDLRAQLMATAERDGIGVTARPEPDDRRGHVAWSARTPGRARARGAIVVGIAAGTLALSGVSVASGEAMPGDALYGVKRSTEKAQLALAGSDLSRGQLYLEFARTRLQEAHAVRTDASGFPAALDDMDGDTRQGVRMLLTSAMERRDTTALDAVDRFVTDQRMLVAQLLDTTGLQSRDKVTDSLTLLDRISKRSSNARTALACGASTAGTDALGPLPKACANTIAQQAPPVEQQPEQPAPEATAKRGNNPQQAGSNTSGGAAAPSASPAPAPAGEARAANGDILGELGRILGGLLG